MIIRVTVGGRLLHYDNEIRALIFFFKFGCYNKLTKKYRGIPGTTVLFSRYLPWAKFWVPPTTRLESWRRISFRISLLNQKRMRRVLFGLILDICATDRMTEYTDTKNVYCFNGKVIKVYKDTVSTTNLAQHLRDFHRILNNFSSKYCMQIRY